jgi:predicted nucleotidyltransferase component of viral defense system
MNSKAMSLKARIRNYAKDNRIAAQVVLQNYMFECFLARLSRSKYRDKFVIKGGMLIAAIVGLDTRSTMDLDTTLRGLPLTEEKVIEAIDEISKINLGDEVSFVSRSIEPIRKDDRYGGFCVRIDAVYDTIVTPLSIDVSTGDIITPGAVLYDFGGFFGTEVHIRLWGYNIETIMAEKVETILSRSVFNTRPRDFYDAFILCTTKKYDKKLFEEALAATAEHRGSTKNIGDRFGIIETITDNSDLRNMWKKYQRRFSYAREIEYEDIIRVLKQLLIG